MNNQSSGFVADGLDRLLRSPEFRQQRAVIEAQVRAEHSEPLASAADNWQRAAIENRSTERSPAGSKPSRPRPTRSGVHGELFGARRPVGAGVTTV